MKKIMIIAGLLSLAFLVSCGQDKTEPVANQSEIQVAEQQEATADIPVLTAYSDDLLGQADNTVLFFHAEWCGSCKTMEKNLLESGTPDNLEVLKIDFDTASELRKKYGVTEKHTFVQVDADGNQLAKWQGSFTLEDLQEKLVSSELSATSSEEGAPEVAVEETEVETTVALAGSYEAYDAALVGKTTNTVLFFHAEWCGTCKGTEASLNASGVSEDLTVLQVNFDDAAELRKQYGVTTKHTFVQVDADGTEISKWQGSPDLADIESKLK